MNNEEQSIARPSITARIWKYKLHYLIVIPAFILLIMFKLLPLVYAFQLPFKDLNFTDGIFHSPWVGMDNFRYLFSDINLKAIISNTLIIKFSYLFVSGILAVVISLALSHIRSRRLGQVYTTIMLLPFFIPTVVLTYIVMLILSIDKSPLPIETVILGQPVFFRSILVIVEVLQTCGIPILIALAAIAAKHRSLSLNEQDQTVVSYLHTHIIPAIRAVGAFLLLQLSAVLSVNFELVYSMVNPLVIEVGETLDYYGFQLGYMIGDISLAGAVWFLQFIIQLVFTILAYLLVRTFFVQDLFSPYEGTSTIRANDRGASWIGTVVGAIYTLAVVFILYLLFVYPFMLESESGIGVGDIMPTGRFILFLVLTFVVVIFHLLITLTLAYPLTVKDLPGRRWYKGFLLIVMLLGTGAISEYMFIHNLGMVSTIFPYVFLGFFNIVSVFVLKSIFNSKYSKLKEEASAQGRGELHSFFYLFIPKVWKPLIALGLLHFVMVWNSYTTSMIYTAQVEQFSPVHLFRVVSTSEIMGVVPGDPVILMLGAIVSLPGIVLLIVFRKWFTSEVMISQVRKL